MVIKYLILFFSLSFISPMVFAKPSAKAPEALKKKCYEYKDVDSCIKVDSFCDLGDKRACVSMSLYWGGQKDRRAFDYSRKACKLGDQASCDLMVDIDKIDKDADEAQSKRHEQARITEAQRNARAKQDEEYAARIEASNAISDFAKSMRSPAPKQKTTTTCVSTPSRNFKGEVEFATDCN